MICTISNFYAVTAGSEVCKLCVCGFVSVGQLSNSVLHCSNVLFHIVPQKGSCSWVYFCPCKRFRKFAFLKNTLTNCAEVQLSTSFERRKMPDVLMYCIYSLPSTSRSSDLGNAATEEEQVGLLGFCEIGLLLLQFCVDVREG